jgi:hypothetical protein
LTSSTPIPSKSSDVEQGTVYQDTSRQTAGDQPLIHPLSAALLIAIDSLWTMADWAAFALLVTIPLSFLAVFLPTYLIQRHMKKDPAGKSAAVAAFLATLAAIPTPITGTLVGTFVLAVAGLRSLGLKK